MPYQLDLVLHSLPKSLNKALRANRWKNHSANKLWDFEILTLVQGKRPPKPLSKAKIRIVRHFYRTLDYDGLVGSLKPVVDALVSAGIIESDSWNVLGVWDVCQQFRQKKAGPLLEISIIEC